jgi:hypothetical protein
LPRQTRPAHMPFQRSDEGISLSIVSQKCLAHRTLGTVSTGVCLTAVRSLRRAGSGGEPLPWAQTPRCIIVSATS